MAWWDLDIITSLVNTHQIWSGSPGPGPVFARGRRKPPETWAAAPRRTEWRRTPRNQRRPDWSLDPPAEPETSVFIPDSERVSQEMRGAVSPPDPTRYTSRNRTSRCSRCWSEPEPPGYNRPGTRTAGPPSARSESPDTPTCPEIHTDPPHIIISFSVKSYYNY